MKNGALGIIGNTKKFLTDFETTKPEISAVAQQTVGGLLIADGLVGLENPFDGQKTRPGILGAISGFGISLVLLFGMSFMGSAMGDQKLTESTTAKIVEVVESRDKDGDLMCKPIAEFTAKNKTIKSATYMSSSTSCSLQSGDTEKILYNPNKPGEWAIASDIKMISTFMLIFKVAIIISAIWSFFQVIIRAAAIFFGIKLFRRGRKLAKAHPLQDNGQTANSIKHKVLTGLFGFTQNGRRGGGFLGGLLSFGKNNNDDDDFMDNNNQQFGQNFSQQQQYGSQNNNGYQQGFDNNNQQFNNQRNQYGNQQQQNNNGLGGIVGNIAGNLANNGNRRGGVGLGGIVGGIAGGLMNGNNNNQQGNQQQYQNQQNYNNGQQQGFNPQNQNNQQYNDNAQGYENNYQQNEQQYPQQSSPQPQQQFQNEEPVAPRQPAPRMPAPRQAPLANQQQQQQQRQQPQQNNSGIANTSQRMGIQHPSRPFRSEENTPQQPQRRNIPSNGFDNYYDDNGNSEIVEKEEYNPTSRRRPSTNTGSIPKSNPFG